MKIAWSLVPVAALALTGAALGADGGRRPETGDTGHMVALYTLHCAGCHLQNGASLPSKGIPDLRQSGRYVGSAEGRRYLLQVPGVSQSTLDDATATALLNWTLERFSGHCLQQPFVPFTVQEMHKWRSAPASNAVSRRAALDAIAPLCRAARPVS